MTNDRESYSFNVLFRVQNDLTLTPHHIIIISVQSSGSEYWSIFLYSIYDQYCWANSICPCTLRIITETWNPMVCPTMCFYQNIDLIFSVSL